MRARHRKCVEELTTEPVLHQEHRSAQSVPRTRVEQFLVKRPPTIVRSTLVLTKKIFPYLKFEVHYLTGRFNPSASKMKTYLLHRRINELKIGKEKFNKKVKTKRYRREDRQTNA